MEVFYDLRNFLVSYILIPLEIFALILALFLIFRWVRKTCKREKGQARPAVRRKNSRKIVHTKQSAIFRGFYLLKILVLIFILIQ